MIDINNNDIISFNDLSYNKEISEILIKLACKVNLPHLIFYGPKGSGKKTRVKLFLQRIYGEGEQIKNLIPVTNTLKVNNKTFNFTYSHSTVHIEINPSDYLFRDKVTIQSIIKDVIERRLIFNSDYRFKYTFIVIQNADSLSKEAQFILRRTMEKYTSIFRLIFICNYISKLINPIRSRCISIRIPAPSKQEIKEYFNEVSKSYQLEVSEEKKEQMADLSSRSMSKACNIIAICK